MTPKETCSCQPESHTRTRPSDWVIDPNCPLHGKLAPCKTCDGLGGGEVAETDAVRGGWVDCPDCSGTGYANGIDPLAKSQPTKPTHQDEAHLKEQHRVGKAYQIIYADPPWPIRWQGSGAIGTKPLKYPTMPVADICSLPVKEIANDLAKLFIWTTNGFLPEALGVVRFWGFQYDKLWTWCKPTGAGGHPRNATEHIIEASRGALPSIGRHEKARNNWFTASTSGHSTKPAAARELIEYCYPSYSKIELFARQRHDGWDAWGNEVDSDIDLEELRNH